MNTIQATVNFDYKGISYKYSSVINADEIINNENYYEFIYLKIAKENNIGFYSYELEVMMDQNIFFNDAKGCAKGCIKNKDLDFILLKKNIEISKFEKQIKELATKYFENIDENINQALREAFILGKNSF